MSSSADECVALWRQAQRSPSIIGFNVSGDLANTVSISLDGLTLSAVDVRLWEGTATPEPEAVFLELLFVDVPASLEERRVGEACVAAIASHLKEQRMGEFQKRLAERKASGLRRRHGGSEVAVEDGDESQDSWRAFLATQDDADPSIRLHTVVNVGGAGRRVLACRTSMGPNTARELGRLAYPRLFKEQTEEEIKAEDRAFLTCYYTCVTCMAVLFVFWAFCFIYGLTKRRNPPLALSQS